MEAEDKHSRLNRSLEQAEAGHMQALTAAKVAKKDLESKLAVSQEEVGLFFRVSYNEFPTAECVGLQSLYAGDRDCCN